MSYPTGKGVRERANTYKTTFPADERNLPAPLFTAVLLRPSLEEVLYIRCHDFTPSVILAAGPNGRVCDVL